MSAVTWIHKTPKSDAFAAYLFEVYSNLILLGKFTLWGAHIAGEKNFVADILSRDLALSVDKVLENIISTGNAKGLTTSSTLQIQPIPSAVNSWIKLILETRMRPGPWALQQSREKYMLGTDGSSFAKLWRSRQTSEVTFIQQGTKSRPLSWRTPEGVDFAEEMQKQLVHRTLVASQTRLVRPSRYGESPKTRFTTD